MEIKELEKYGIPSRFIECFRQEEIKKLYPPQIKAIQKNILSLDRNFVLSFPTASGKTLLASLLAIKTLTRENNKVIYIVPLVALAGEKYSYYKKLFPDFKVALSVGDMDSSEPWLEGYDFIIATTEKFDSLIRHGIPWLKDVGLVVVDEIHLINDYKRGPTLEVVITQLRRLSPEARILALSATISNAEELSLWLDAELIASDFRPVKLYEGINFESTIQFEDRKGYILNEKLSCEEAIFENTLKLNKQVLFFVSSRRNAEALAERLKGRAGKFVRDEEKELLSNLAKDALGALETSTHQCRRLAKCVEEGTSFHHAGLIAAQKRLVEDGFRRGIIKAIVATPTLAMGVNLPCFRVVVRDVKRYYPKVGSEYIPTMEYKQFVGRAGRPQYDKFGEAILIARSEEEKDALVERYINGEPEDINSKLAQISIMRMHILSLVACDFSRTIDELCDFFGLTLFGLQYRDLNLIKDKIETVLNELTEWSFIYQDGKILKAANLGKRISRLYLDPRTAYSFITALNQIEVNQSISELGILQLICAAEEIYPPLRLRESDTWKLNEFIIKESGQFINKPPSIWDDNFEEFASSVKLALMFEAWISEQDEEFILNNFQVTPGELYSKREIADWLLYSLTELSGILKMKTSASLIKKLKIRLHYGVKEELLELVSLKDIGRKRARRLFEAGLKNAFSLGQTSEKHLVEILGTKVAASIKKQILFSQGQKGVL